MIDPSELGDIVLDIQRVTDPEVLVRSEIIFQTIRDNPDSDFDFGLIPVTGHPGVFVLGTPEEARERDAKLGVGA